jgi:hypothetical protein
MFSRKAEMKNNSYQIEYEFLFQEGNVKRFLLSLDAGSLSLISEEPIKKPDWARLEFHQCSCCPLTKEESEYCPLSLNIVDIVDEFSDIRSFKECTVKCTTPERTYTKDTSVQEGLSSIFGIVMATSECPKMGLFRPMARFHLPFSTVEESIIRSASFFLLRKYLESARGSSSTCDLRELEDHYKEIQLVNSGILARIKAITNEDADSNAVIVLNSMAQLLDLECGESLSSLGKFFTK